MTLVLPEGYKPSADEEYMAPLQLEYFRQKLETWRDDILAESENFLDTLKETSLQEPDVADRGSLEADKALEFRTKDRQRKLLSKIEQALERIQDGSYGYCKETDQEIGLKRLEARPVAELCIEAQEQHERDEKK